MRIGRLLCAVSLAAALSLFISNPRTALADNVVMDDQIVQGNMCVGSSCVTTAAAETLAGLEPVTFAYRGAPGDGRVGFIAEDVPELVATPGRQTLSALEIVAVLTKVVQEQQRVVQEQQKALAELTARLSALETRP